MRRLKLYASVKCALGAGALVVSLSFSGVAAAGDRYAAFVIDAQSGEVLHADMAEERRYPASLTKMMTLYLLFEAVERGQLSLSTRMPVSRNASRQPPSKLGLRRGESIRVEDAIRALIVKSGNDVAVVVAEKLAGSEARFAARMTARARELGMSDTQFMNASGLPNARQVTTARDMAALSAALLRDFPQYYAYFQSRGMSWRSRHLEGHNRLLDELPGMDGIKTGYTNASGFNLASSVERDGRRVIGVVLGGETARTRDAQMAHLIEGAFEQIALRTGETRSAVYTSLPALRASPQIDAETGAGAYGEGGEPPFEQDVIEGALALEEGSADRIRYLAPVPNGYAERVAGGPTQRVLGLGELF